MNKFIFINENGHKYKGTYKQWKKWLKKKYYENLLKIKPQTDEDDNLITGFLVTFISDEDLALHEDSWEVVRVG